MRPVPAKQLKRDLASARQAGNVEESLAILGALEQAEPQEGSWPHRAAEIQRKRARPELEVACLLRAAERFRAAGFLLKAIAVCKRVLEIDAGHAAARAILASLSEQRGIPSAPSPARPSPVAARAQAPGGADSDDWLEDLLLTDVVPSSPIEDLAEPMEGAAEILLDPRPAAADTSAERVDPDLAQLLLHTPLFSSLQPEELAQLIEGAEVMNVAEGEAIFHEGDAGDALFVIVEGAVTLVCDGPARRMIAALGEGEFLGEGALLRSQPRNATARAVVDTTLLRMGHGLLRGLIDRSPQVLVVLLRFLRDRLTLRLLRTSPLFEALGVREHVRLARRFRFLEAAPGATLIYQGKRPHALFLLLSGALDVRLPGSAPIAQLEPGDVCGEISLLTGDPAIASVVTRTSSWLLFLPAHEVESLLSDARVRPRIEAIAAQRRRENTANDRSLSLE